MKKWTPTLLALVSLLTFPGALLAQASAAKPAEPHLANLQKLTAGGENAEAYWSFDGKQLVFQSRPVREGCDQIYTMDADGAHRKRVSTGEGRTTCAYFLKDGSRILFASTHAGSPDCPPEPDRSKGYVWPLFPTYRIYSAKPDGSDLKCLTPWEGYSAEATVSPDGKSVVFTSDKDGDLELYAMDVDGQNVRRLTTTPGYDGGAFYSPDSKQIVFRGFHPEGAALEEYRALLREHLVRPSVMELYVCDADGKNVRQVTKNGAANFCPFFTADGKRILFSSNLGDPQRREFDLYLVNTDGTGLEQVTFSPGFDGFPMLSPDGKRLAFCSNRDGGQPGETNVFVAEWLDAPPPPLPEMVVRAAQSTFAPEVPRLRADVSYLASDALQGRLTGTPEGRKAAEYVAAGFQAAGLKMVPGMTGFYQEFEFVARVLLGEANTLTFTWGKEGAFYKVGEDFMPATFSEDASLENLPLVFAGFGITAPDGTRDDYAGLDVKGKVVAVYKWGPDGDDPKSPYALYYPPRYKALTAREKGAAALLIVSPDASDDELPDLKARASAGGGSLPVLTVKRAVLERWLKAAGKGLPDPKRKEGLAFDAPGFTVSLTTALVRERAKADNVLAWLPATVPSSETVVVGAHYDHLGTGIEGSLAEKMGAVHPGADDNASGTAAILELARLFAAQKERGRNLLFAAFGGEELGTLGSSNFVKNPPVDLKTLVAMFNFDMVGRLRDKKLVVNGAGTSPQFKPLLDRANTEGLKLTLHDDGYGASDQGVFYGKEIPVLFFFTGAHEQYHRPEDTADLVDYDGEGQVLRFAGRVLNGLLALPERPGYIRVAVSPSQQAGRSFRVYMGTIPDFTEEVKGVKIQGVRPGSPAELGGLKAGDVLVSFAGKKIENLYDYTFVLQEHKPGETLPVVVLRDGKETPLTVTLTRKPGD